MGEIGAHGKIENRSCTPFDSIKTEHDNKVFKFHSSLFLPLSSFSLHAISHKLYILRAQGGGFRQGGYRAVSNTSYATADSLDSEISFFFDSV